MPVNESLAVRGWARLCRGLVKSTVWIEKNKVKMLHSVSIEPRFPCCVASLQCNCGCPALPVTSPPGPRDSTTFSKRVDRWRGRLVSACSGRKVSPGKKSIHCLIRISTEGVWFSYQAFHGFHQGQIGPGRPKPGVLGQSWSRRRSFLLVPCSFLGRPPPELGPRQAPGRVVSIARC